MSDFQRYGIYYLPDDPGLAGFGAAWLGWDAETGAPVPQPEVPGIEAITQTPRKYGFHGTLKPPFRLAEGHSAQGLQDAMSAFAARTAPLQIEGLQIARLGRFLALVPEGDAAALGRLAFACVTEFDDFRRPAPPEELERRRAGGLNPSQEAMLLQWGYPHVGENFRFHMTLTGKLPVDQLGQINAAVQGLLPPLSQPMPITSVSLVGERSDGMFQLVHRYALSG